MLDCRNAISYGVVVVKGLVEDAPHFRVIDVQCHLLTRNPFGWAVDGILKVEGRVRHATLISSGPNSAVLEVENSLGQLDRADFSTGNRWMQTESQSLLCLLIGCSKSKSSNGPVLQYVLVLQRSESSPDCYERVGMLQFKRFKLWFTGATVEELTIV